ncbi:hypothetical protein [uncultured Devosia sp.]|uniref:hypothetical protein n=1 Tax=uncultured Devosia sp. TaxID=211434 RepID=UPI00261A9220|nr:hypothetical protein [uncultured Devosia sp.]
MNNTIVYLIGHFGVGKLTVARAICALTDARLFDNHLANNVIFSLIRADGRTPLPEGVWDLIGIIRDQAFKAIEEMTPRNASFVLTNCLIESDPRDHAAYEQVKAVAARRGNVFVPVLLAASDAAHAARVNSPDRSERLKLTDVEGAARKRRTEDLLRIEHPNRLDLDTSDMPPEEAARSIIAHAERLK